MTITIKQVNLLFMLPLSFYTLLTNGDISQRDGQIGRIRLKQPKRRYSTFGRSHTNIARDLTVRPLTNFLFNDVIQMISSNFYYLPTMTRA